MHTIPQLAELQIEGDQDNSEGTILATTHILAIMAECQTKQGNRVDELDEIHIVTSSVLLKMRLSKSNLKTKVLANFFFKFLNGNQFQMLCSPGNKINDSQVIGELIDTNYKDKNRWVLKI